MAKHFVLRKIEEENENTFEKSKIGGSPVFPDGFLEKNHLNDSLFIAQLNLADINDDLLPKEGFLYFFLNVTNYPYQAQVIYTTDEIIEVITDINEEFEEFGGYEGYEIVISDDQLDEDTGFSIVSEIDANLDMESIVDTKDLICLLELDSLELPEGVLTLGQPDGWYLFLITKEDLMKRNFKNVKFVTYGS